MMISGSALARRLVWAGLAEFNDGCRRGHNEPNRKFDGDTLMSA